MYCTPGPHRDRNRRWSLAPTPIAEQRQEYRPAHENRGKLNPVQNQIPCGNTKVLISRSASALVSGYITCPTKHRVSGPHHRGYRNRPSLNTSKHQNQYQSHPKYSSPHSEVGVSAGLWVYPSKHHVLYSQSSFRGRRYRSS